MRVAPLVFIKAFALNFVFFAAGILVYMLFIPGNAMQIAALVGLSVLFTVRRVRLIRVVERQIAFQDESLFLSIVEDYVRLKDRWTATASGVQYRRYEAPLNVGLYRFQAVLEVRLHGRAATLTGHARIVDGLMRELEYPYQTRMARAS